MLFRGDRLDQDAQGVVLMADMTFRIDERFEEKYLDGLAEEIRMAVIYICALQDSTSRFVYSVTVEICRSWVRYWSLRVGLPHFDLTETTHQRLDPKQKRISYAIATALKELRSGR